MEQLLQNYKDKEKMAQEAVNKLLASQAKLGDEVGKLRQQMETEKLEFQKQLDDLMQERDTYKAKAEEMHAPTSEDKVIIEHTTSLLIFVVVFVPIHSTFAGSCATAMSNQTSTCFYHLICDMTVIPAYPIPLNSFFIPDGRVFSSYSGFPLSAQSNPS